MCCHCMFSTSPSPEKAELEVGGGLLPTFLKNRNTVHYSRRYPPPSPTASWFSRSFPTSSSSSSLVSLIELFITSFTKVVYHTARRDEVTQRVNLRLILFEKAPPFSFEPPRGSLYGQRGLTEPVVRVKLFRCYSCSFREARGVVDRPNQRGWQASWQQCAATRASWASPGRPLFMS